jgi:hypothetical protein
MTERPPPLHTLSALRCLVRVASLCTALWCTDALAEEPLHSIAPSTLGEDVLLAPVRGPRLRADPVSAHPGPSLRVRSESARRWLRLGIPLLVGAGAATLVAELPEGSPENDAKLLPVARSVAAANLLLGAVFVGFGAYRVRALGDERPTPLHPGVRIASVLASVLMAGGAFATVGVPYLVASLGCHDRNEPCT